MTTFEDWALSYVLTEPDEESVLREIAKKAATEIESSRASRTVVANWASSVRSWVSPAHAGAQAGDGDLTDNVVSRARALDFMASTLIELDENLLSSDQVQLLVVYFGSMFSSDHKAGIQPSTKALRRLYGMKHFHAAAGVKIIEDVTQIGDDISDQLASTRRDIFQLILLLIQDARVSAELRQRYSTSCDFVAGVLRIGRKERDPDNLMACFSIYRELLAEYAPSREVAASIFDVFSSYFPISIRQSATPSGVTADDLKAALRACFASCRDLAPSIFPFLLQKLDLGDAVTLAVKLDILQTIRSCAESYAKPQESLAPYADKVWNSLKYEVRNGEIKEAITATLDVLRIFAKRLGSVSPDKEVDAIHPDSFVGRVWSDCCDDVDNPTYTKQAGLLLVTVTTANTRVFLQSRSRVLGLIKKSLGRPKSPSQTRDLLGLVNAFLNARSELVQNRKSVLPGDDQRDDEGLLAAESRSFFDEVFELQTTHTPAGAQEESRSSELTQEETEVLVEIYRGYALLISQQSVLPDGRVALSCPRTVCDAICSHLYSALFARIDAEIEHTPNLSLDEEVVQALRTAVVYYRDGFGAVLDRFRAVIDASSPARIRQRLDTVKEGLARLAFVGCSQLPADTPIPPEQSSSSSSDLPPREYSALQHLEVIVHSFLFSQMFPALPAPPLPASLVGGEFEADAQAEAERDALLRPHLVGAVHTAMLHFRDACVSKHGPGVLLVDDKLSSSSSSSSSSSWIAGFRDGAGFQQQAGGEGQWHPRVAEDDPAGVYREFLRLGLFTVWSLYRRATTEGNAAVYDEGVVRSIGYLAPLVVRGLDEKTQLECGLAREAFDFFHVSTTPTQLEPQAAVGGEAGEEMRKEKRHDEYLSLGILQGLWPGAMEDLYKPGGVAERFMCNADWHGGSSSNSSRDGVAQARASITAILANKYRPGKTTTDPDSQVMKNVLGFWADRLKDPSFASSSSRAFEVNVHFAMHVVAGAIARQDRLVLPLAPVLHDIIGRDDGGDTVARAMGILVRDMHCLAEENHAVLRRLAKQWTYQHFVRPLYERASPAGKGPAGMRYATAVLAMVSHCAFAVYQDDVDALCRILVTVLSSSSPSSPPSPSASTIPSALKILATVLANQPDAVRGHLKSVVAGAQTLYRSAADTAHADARTREAVLRLLAALPTHLESSDLAPFAPDVRRFLATTSGDAVRAVRTVALEARRGWEGVA